MLFEQLVVSLKGWPPGGCVMEREGGRQGSVRDTDRGVYVYRQVYTI